MLVLAVMIKALCFKLISLDSYQLENSHEGFNQQYCFCGKLFNTKKVPQLHSMGNRECEKTAKNAKGFNKSHYSISNFSIATGLSYSIKTLVNSFQSQERFPI